MYLIQRIRQEAANARHDQALAIGKMKDSLRSDFWLWYALMPMTKTLRLPRYAVRAWFFPVAFHLMIVSVLSVCGRSYSLLAHTTESLSYKRDAVIGGPEAPRSLFC
jgi:hypothetical protein